MITHGDVGPNEDIARVVLVIARSIAPSLNTLADDSEPQRDAIAVLRGVYGDVVTRGSRSVKSQRIGSAAVDYSDVSSAFDGDPARALRALCATVDDGRLPVGSFPAARRFDRVWPEGEYT